MNDDLDASREPSDRRVAIIVIGLFLLSWAAHGWTAWHAFSADAAEHGQTVEVAQFLMEFWRQTLENWQSEWLQVITLFFLADLWQGRRIKTIERCTCATEG